MKKIIYISIALLGILYACQEDPAFPDPGFDTTSDVSVTVRRDTIDHYYIKGDMKVPNGVNKIEILNGLTYEVIDEVPDYNGQQIFQFEYKVDLTAITDSDSTLYYTVKIIDNDLRTYNKAFSIEVKRFSEPTISINGLSGSTLGVVSQVFELSAQFETGLYNMERYKVIFDGKTIDQGFFEKDTALYDYSFVCNEPMVKNQDYTLTIELEDEREEVRSQSISVVMVDMKRPVKVFRLNEWYGEKSLSREFNMAYNFDKPYLLDSIYGYTIGNTATGKLYRPITYKFYHNEFNMVERVESWWGDPEDDYATELREMWAYEYDEKQRLTQVYDLDEESEYDVEILEWHEDGRVKTYRRDPHRGGIAMELPYVQNAAGEFLHADSWLLRTRSIIVEYSPIPNPLHYKYLPPFYPDYNTRYLDLEILLMQKYGVVEVQEYKDEFGFNHDLYVDQIPEIIGAYATDSNGNMTINSLKDYNSYSEEYNLYEEYSFIYE
ncbi:hypothetical protein [Carboxylicivirga sp. RSCT41]|uniref:hypothetical protein n=1 Tax=Carboxylicivirga agarovorans TaxID=3417570 RepID=UPI003D34635A